MPNARPFFTGIAPTVMDGVFLARCLRYMPRPIKPAPGTKKSAPTAGLATIVLTPPRATRDDQSLQLETRYDNAASELVVILHWQDGRRDIERFTDLATFGARLVGLEQQLEAERWKHAGPPVILPDGWPNRRLT